MKLSEKLKQLNDELINEDIEVGSVEFNDAINRCIEHAEQNESDLDEFASMPV